MAVAQVGSDVNNIADPTARESDPNTELVGDGSREEPDNSEGRVQSGVGTIHGFGVPVAAAAETVDGVEHAWAKKANEGDENELDLRARIPRNGEFPDLAAFVHPSGRTYEWCDTLID